MAVTGYTFDLAQVSSAADSSLYDFLGLWRNCVIPNRLNNMAISTSGLTLTVDTGQALYQGRFVQFDAPTSLSLSGNSSGFIVLTIDLTQTNTSSGTTGDDYQATINQARIESVTSVTTSDLHNGGLISSMILASWTSDASTITATPQASTYTPKVIFPIGMFSLESDRTSSTAIPIEAPFTNISGFTSGIRNRGGIAVMNLYLTVPTGSQIPFNTLTKVASIPDGYGLTPAATTTAAIGITLNSTNTTSFNGYLRINQDLSINVLIISNPSGVAFPPSTTGTGNIRGQATWLVLSTSY